jgi:solute carrier family 9 (sodium/hydrogen exchanger), member 6/7
LLTVLGLGIVSLLFCGITLKHYAYFNMSRRTQLTTKYLFQVLAQLSENFIFIYLGLSLFTEKDLQYQPLLIIVTIVAVAAARWVAVFPLSRMINWFIRYRAHRRGRDASDELPYAYQAMLFWAGLRGAVGVALAALLTGKDSYALKATVLVVVVLTVIIFGGTTARMLEILGIRTGVVEEIDSDDEFDIEAIGSGSYYKRSGTGIGFMPRHGNNVALDRVDSANANANGKRRHGEGGRSGWASGTQSPHVMPRPSSLSRTSTSRNNGDASQFERSDLLGTSGNTTDDDIDFGSDVDTSDLPPAAPRRRSSTVPPSAEESGGASTSGAHGTDSPYNGGEGTGTPITAAGALRQLFSTEDPSALFRQLDEDYIKPKLLLDSGGRNGSPGPA